MPAGLLSYACRREGYYPYSRQTMLTDKWRDLVLTTHSLTWEPIFPLSTLLTSQWRTTQGHLASRNWCATSRDEAESWCQQNCTMKLHSSHRGCCWQLTLSPPPTSPRTFPTGTLVFSKWTSQTETHEIEDLKCKLVCTWCAGMKCNSFTHSLTHSTSWIGQYRKTRFLSLWSSYFS